MLRRRKRTLLILILIFLCSYIFLQYIFRSSPRHRRLTLFDQIHSQDNLLLRPSICFTKTEKKNVRRAILVHFPTILSIKYIPELKWLYLSWIEIIQKQPSNWQTDLLIYSSPSSFLDELGCVQYTKDRSIKNSCFRIDYSSIWNRTNIDNELFRLIRIHLPNWCLHLDSLGILTENIDLLTQYDYVLRTDLDTFLTPAFAHYIPFDCSFQTGLGGYSFEYSIHRLSRIAQTLNLLDVHLTDIGSTWYGPPKQVILVGRLALWLSIWLSQNEFTVVEKDQRFAILSWPQWYIGVISMYASHLAISHYAGRGQIKLIQKPYLIDYSCTNNVSFDDFEIIHIHAWHTDKLFSKFLFKNGTYDQLFSSSNRLAI